LRAAEKGLEGAPQRTLVRGAAPSPSRSALTIDEEGLGDERGTEGDSLRVAQVVTEVAEGAAPGLPGREHGLDLRAVGSRGGIVRVGRIVVPRDVLAGLTGRRVCSSAEPLLERAQRHQDGGREAVGIEVGMLLAQIEDEATEGVVIAPPLGPAVDAPGVVHHEGRHGAAQLVRRVGVDWARLRRRAPNGP
jgi:hypothetical protein